MVSAPMRRTALLLSALAMASLAACRGHAGAAAGDDVAESLEAGDPVLSAEELLRRQCKASFALCAPPMRFGAETDLDEVELRNLVQIASRLDVNERLAEKAARRLRDVVERGSLEDVREVALAWESASRTLARCRCPDERFRAEFEKQEIARFLAARLPPAELRDPEYWARRVIEQVGTLRLLTRRSAEMLAQGDEAGRATLDAEVRRAEVELCETLHAAHDVLPEPGMEAMRASVYRSLARTSGEASVELARRLIDRHEHAASCVPAER